MKQVKILTIFAGCALVAVALFAQSPQPPPVPDNPASDTNAVAAATNSPCQMMKQMRQQLHDQIKAQDQELKSLTDDLNNATADRKVDMLVTVVNKLVQDRLTTHQMMEQNMQIMHHLMQHMGTNVMRNCPAWQSMTNQPENNPAPPAPQ